VADISRLSDRQLRRRRSIEKGRGIFLLHVAVGVLNSNVSIYSTVLYPLEHPHKVPLMTTCNVLRPLFTVATQQIFLFSSVRGNQFNVYPPLMEACGDNEFQKIDPTPYVEFSASISFRKLVAE
jgi:hypothetical protein